MNEKLLLIGKILKPHGLRGEHKAVFFVDDPKDLKPFTKFFIPEKSAWREIRFESITAPAGRFFVKIAGCDDRTAAEMLRNTDVMVRESELPPVKKKGSYYVRDLIGLAAEQDGQPVGELTNVFGIAHRTMAVVRKPDGKEIVFPFTDEYVREVSLEEKTIRVTRLNELE